jgi:hypothetical protein
MLRLNNLKNKVMKSSVKLKLWAHLIGLELEKFQHQKLQRKKNLAMPKLTRQTPSLLLRKVFKLSQELLMETLVMDKMFIHLIGYRHQLQLEMGVKLLPKMHQQKWLLENWRVKDIPSSLTTVEMQVRDKMYMLLIGLAQITQLQQVMEVKGKLKIPHLQKIRK